MKTANSVTRRVITVLLCLSLLCGMVVGTIGMPAVASTETVDTYKVDFADLATVITEAGGEFNQYGLYRGSDGTTAADKWIAERFTMYSNNEGHSFAVREYLGQSPIQTYKTNGNTAGSYTSNWTPHKDGYLRFNTGGSYNDGMLRNLELLTVKDALLENFELKMTFKLQILATTYNSVGGVAVTFHDVGDTPGKFAYSSTGSDSPDMVFVGSGKQAYDADYRHGFRIKKAGVALADSYTAASSASYPDNDVALEQNVEYVLYLKVVNGDLTVGITKADGTEVYANTEFENAVSNQAGAISFGISSQEHWIKSVEITELDEWGEAVDYGTYAAKATAENYAVDFADLATVINNDANYTWGNYNLFHSDGNSDADKWIAERFTMYSNREGHTFSAREYLGQKGNVENLHKWTPHSSGYLRLNGVSDGMLRTIETLSVKDSYLKNFEAELTFKLEKLATTYNTVGGVVVTFHETGIPGFIDYNSTGHGSTDMVFVGSGKQAYEADFRHGFRIKKAGEALTDSYTAASSSFYPDNDVALAAGVNYTLYIKVVNGDLTLGIMNADTGDVLYPKTVFEDAVSDKAGSISFGMSNQEHWIKSFAVTELDENGKAVDYGTLADKPAVAYYQADFTDLAGMLMYSTQLVQNPAADTAYQPLETTAANDANIQAWMDAKFSSMYTNREGHTFAERTYLAQQDHYADPYHTRGYWEIIHEGYLRYYSGGDGMMRTINTMTIANGENAAQLKNFEANLRFRLGNVGDTKYGGVVLSFHETGVAGKIDWNGGDVDNPDFVFVGTGMKVANEETTYPIGIRIKKAGDNLTDSTSAVASTKYPDIAAALSAMVEYDLYVKVVNGDLTVGITDATTGAVVMAETLYEDAVSDAAGSLSVGAAANGGLEYLKSVQVVQLDNDGDPVAFGSEIEESHVDEWETTYTYDDDNHWFACADDTCENRKDEAAHTLTYVAEGGKHYQTCDCGYKTTAVAHDYTESDVCACGTQKDNTAVVDGNTITVKAGEGYQLKAGSLIVTDANGNTFVPERVGYRNGGNASRYTIPADAVAPCTVDAEFYQPGTETGYNMGLIGTSVHTEDSGLRFIHRLNIDKDGNMLYNGENVAIKEYGLLLASGAVLKNAEGLDIETADESMHVHQFAWPETDKYYDLCDDHVDIAIHVKNIAAYNGQDTDLITRTYIILGDDTVVYGDVAVSTYNEALA